MSMRPRLGERIEAVIEWLLEGEGVMLSMHNWVIVDNEPNVETVTAGSMGQSIEQGSRETWILIETEKYSNGYGQYLNESLWRSSEQIDLNSNHCVLTGDAWLLSHWAPSKSEVQKQRKEGGELENLKINVKIQIIRLSFYPNGSETCKNKKVTISQHSQQSQKKRKKWNTHTEYLIQRVSRHRPRSLKSQMRKCRSFITVNHLHIFNTLSLNETVPYFLHVIKLLFFCNFGTTVQYCSKHLPFWSVSQGQKHILRKAARVPVLFCLHAPTWSVFEPENRISFFFLGGGSCPEEALTIPAWILC